MTIPSVSVLVVSRNYGRFLAECLESCVTQTVRPLEFIYVDDASEDDSMAVAARFHDFRAVHLPERRGANGARNIAASEAKGDCLLFIDGDNILEPAFLEKSLTALTPGVPFVYPNIERFGDNLPDAGIIAPEWGEKDLRVANFCDTSSLMRSVALKAVGGWDESLPFWHDWHLFLRMARLGAPRKSGATLRHRYHPDSITATARAGVDMPAFQEQIVRSADSSEIDWPAWETHLADHGVAEPFWHRSIVEERFSERWMSRLPLERVKSGRVPAYNDQRIEWLIYRLGGVAGKSILELGSMEGGHSYMLSRAGANVTAIEGNQDSYLRTLVAKEALGMRASFVPADFREYLKWCVKAGKRFDIILAAGVLYHVPNPAEMALQMSSITDCAFVWSHYYDESKLEASERGARYFSGAMEPIECNGFRCLGYRRDYDVFPTRRGGLEQYSLWLRKWDVVALLNAAGFSRFEICFDEDKNAYGPAFACLVCKN